MLGTLRTEESRAGLDALGVQRARGHGLPVRRLEQDSVGTTVADMLAMDRPPQAFTEFLGRESEGNPFFVAEYLRAAIAEGVLARDESGDAGSWRRCTRWTKAWTREALVLPYIAAQDWWRSDAADCRSPRATCCRWRASWAGSSTRRCSTSRPAVRPTP